MDIFSIFFNMKVCYVFTLESPHEYTQYTIHNINKNFKVILNYPKHLMSATIGIFPRDSRTSSKQP